MLGKNIFLSLLVSVCCYSTVSEAFFLRNMFGGLFGRRAGLPSRRVLRNPPNNVGQRNRIENNNLNNFNNFNNLANQLAHGNNFIDPRIANLNQFANLGFNVDGNFPGSGFNNFSSFGNSLDSCANQFQFACNNQDLKQVSCTAEGLNGQVMEAQSNNVCAAVQSLRQQVCQTGFSTSSLGNSNITCREFQGNTIVRQGSFSGTPGQDFIAGQVVLGLGSSFNNSQVQSLVNQLGGSVRHQFSNQRGLMVLQVPAGQESSFCNQILSSGLSLDVRSCNPNLFVQGQFESGNSGVFQRNNLFLGGLRRF